MKIRLGKILAISDAHRPHPAGVGRLDSGYGILKDDAVLGLCAKFRRALQKHLRVRLGLADLRKVHFIYSFQGLSKDFDKLPTSDDMAAGSSCLFLDNGTYAQYHAGTKTWYLI